MPRLLFGAMLSLSLPWPAAIAAAALDTDATAAVPAATPPIARTAETAATTVMPTSSAATDSRDFSFAVLSNMPTSMANEHDTQAMLQSIALAGRVRFIVDLGNVRGADESCGNALFSRRRAILDTTPAPVVFVPGMRDWVDCARPGVGAFDPIERLDTVRDLFLSGNVSLGAPPMHVIRQSELPAFTPYRENMRWIDNGVVFVTLNVPGGNNHFVDGGGRNGEYEDREVANRNWIDHGVTDAQRRHARGLVFLFEGDPGFASSAAQASQRSGSYRWATSFDWWFRRPRERDGYASLRRDLLQALTRFNGPVLIIHGRDARRTNAMRAAESVRAKNAAMNRHETHQARRDGKPIDIPQAPAVAVETLTRAPDGLLLRDVQQVMVDNPTGSRQWLRVTLPSIKDSRSNAASLATTRNDAAGATHLHGPGREHLSPSRSATFRIRVESIDDGDITRGGTNDLSATQASSSDAVPARDVTRGPILSAPSNASASTTTTTSPTSTSSLGSTGNTASPTNAADASNAVTSEQSAQAWGVTNPSPPRGNNQGLAPWPGVAYRFQPQDTVTHIASPATRADDTASTGSGAGEDERGNAFIGANAKSTSEHDVLRPATAASSSAPISNTISNPSSAGGTYSGQSALPGDLPEPTDPIENGIDDSNGTSALNGITRPTMLPLPPRP